MGTVGVGAVVGEGGSIVGGGGVFYRLLMVPKLPFAVFSSPATTQQSSKRTLFVQTPRQKAVFCPRIRDFTNKFLPRLRKRANNVDNDVSAVIEHGLCFLCSLVMIELSAH